MSYQKSDKAEVNVLIKISSKKISQLVLEPWGEEIQIKLNDEVRMCGVGPAANSFIELDCGEESICVTSWKDSTLSVSINGNTLDTASAVIPSL
ncbi:hypothetical protein [Andreprevotia chitinilytica]|uniref:hypothetical protein n=1 Tax=Andreprevotia chitinilytica TaxID=396808 RepID=UPI0012EBAED4|nr:hypothetical protein [Andreprevotia chitinilytica]